MLVLGKNYVQMTQDFEKAVICALLLRFRKKAKKENARSTLSHPVL
jgi:hypothetical protein